MKILYIVNVLPDSENPSAEPFVKAQIDSVKALGHDIAIMNVKGSQSKLHYLFAIFKLRKLLKMKNFDLIHGHYVYSGLIAALQRRVPTVVSFMGSDLLGSLKSTGSLQIRGYIDILLSALLQFFVDGIIVKSNRMKKKLICPSISAVISNGVDFGLFKEMDRNETRRNLGLEIEKYYVLFVGNEDSPENKGYHIIQDAMRILRKNHGGIELLTVVKTLHNEMSKLMNAANLLVLASIKEGSPNVIKEAMACNLPIIATDVGDVREITDGVDGCKIVKRDPVEFAKAIKEILSTVDRTNGRQKIEHLKIEKVAQRLVNFYAQVIDRKKTRLAR